MKKVRYIQFAFLIAVFIAALCRASAAQPSDEDVVFKALNERGITIVIITHDMKLVAEYARRAAVLIEGRTAFEGPVRELYQDSALLQRAGLDVPPLYAVSQKLHEGRPEFPLLMTVEEFKEEICARSGTCRETVFSTA